jgi:NAD(P)H-dependent flavin oxidoreductase YrpB (nitropropane dioxygenase family)
MGGWDQNRLTTKLGIDYPIVQGPLGGLSSQRLPAAVSNFGGLGSFVRTGRDQGRNRRDSLAHGQTVRLLQVRFRDLNC